MPEAGAGFTLREPALSDVPAILGLIRALAEYERLAHECRATEGDLRLALFGTPPRAHAVLAETAGEAIGLALWFHNFSTFTGRAGIYLEDLFVQPAHRGRGIGRALFRHLARRALAEDCARLEWSVLDWNEPAIRFYRAIGAHAQDDWTVQRLSGPALQALAA